MGPSEVSLVALAMILKGQVNIRYDFTDPLWNDAVSSSGGREQEVLQQLEIGYMLYHY